MATERSLARLLRSLQTASELEDAYALLPTATSFLAILTNPLNVTLLASQLLSSPAIWDNRVDLQTCRRIISVFNTAAITILQHEETDEPKAPYAPRKGLDREAWVKAVVAGADERSPRWRHLLLLGGVLLGFEGQNRQGLPSHLRTKLESGLVQATDLALNELGRADDIAGYAITMVLNHTFELLSDFERSQLNYDRLLPVMVRATFLSAEGLEGGYFLGAIDRDVVEAPGKKFLWSAGSASYKHMEAISAKPLISALGPLSRLIAHAVENVHDRSIISGTVDYLADFVRTLMIQWRQNKLSEIDRSEELDFLEAESLKTTVPALWKLLRTCMFSITIVLRAVLGRVLNDRVLAANKSAPFLSMQVLHILRNLYFVSSRIGQNASSQYSFVYLTAIDILSQYTDLTENFLRSIKPAELGQIPAHPLERCLDLFFLNTAEHLTLTVSPETSEELLITASLPYLAKGGNNHLLEIFEAAHSVVLAVLAAPKSAKIAANHLPFYIDNLFAVFPQNLSARQFRLAYKTILQITAPPSPLANSQPLLPSTLLELLHDRAQRADSNPLTPPKQTLAAEELTNPPPPVSEQAALILALIDCLCFLRVEDLEEWLPLTAHLINKIQNPEMRAPCVERFWEALSDGEMDVERAHFCVLWWSTRGGRELVLYGAEGDADSNVEDGPYMSGAIGGAARDSKL
ncbi:peroxisomal membrane protein Pex17, putative [Paecilomyces variotii No. 5]|uniref:Peroxisomal membrane protein Pex17, putative n=1 Tax=Byssochlamys spectabilis (strain No. 5 / NBRC 109023) TaxID=1356009 RepID=V5GC31_BYSSN|nr:peroxisomal membrane protein Pex17, putative [Paecilomyces variotii No. 5]